MSNTYDWNIYRLDVFDNYDGKENVVFGVNWILSGTDGTFSSSISGNTRVSPYVSGSTFVPYSSLTKDIVLGWTTGSMTQPELVSYYESIDNDINKQKNPAPIESFLTPPWL